MQTEKYYVVSQIEKALFELLKEKEYTDITVTDLIKKAEVSRASFYRHYKSISEVMDRVIDDAVKQLTDPKVLPVFLSSDREKVRDILYQYTCRNLEAHELLSACLPSNVAMIFSRMMTYLQNNVDPDTGISRDDKYHLSARNGVVNSILMRWIADGKIETKEEIVDLIMEFIMRL